MGFDKTFTHKGRTFGVRYPYDDNADPPWEMDDGHGPVSGWRPRSDKAPHERILHADGGTVRLYDARTALALAKRDRWGTSDGQRPDETTRAYRARAVDEDFDRLRAWCRDEWTYIGVVVILLDAHGQRTEFSEALWGIESDAGAYLDEVATELAEEILASLPDAVAQSVAKLQALLTTPEDAHAERS